MVADEFEGEEPKCQEVGGRIWFGENGGGVGGGIVIAEVVVQPEIDPPLGTGVDAFTDGGDLRDGGG